MAFGALFMVGGLGCQCCGSRGCWLIWANVDQWLVWRVEEDKEKFLERVACTEQDFSAGSDTTFFFILAPDHTLHPIQEVRSWNLLMPRGSMLGNCKARTWGLYLSRLRVSRLASATSYSLTVAACGQPYSLIWARLPLSPCGRANFRGKDSERHSPRSSLQGLRWGM